MLILHMHFLVIPCNCKVRSLSLIYRLAKDFDVFLQLIKMPWVLFSCTYSFMYFSFYIDYRHMYLDLGKIFVYFQMKLEL
jgi:hypothetical protein